MSAQPSTRGAVRRLVVVGAGLAGLQSVAAARAAGFDGHLTLVGAEDVPPYDRPPLSKELFTRPEPVWLADDLGLDLRLADEVALGEAATGLAVSPTGVVVRTDRGVRSADAAVLATGARAVLPAHWDARTLRTLADARDLREALAPGRRLVVLGAGWVGAEVAGTAAAAGSEVTVVEAGAAPSAGSLGHAVGELTRPWYSAAGVRLETGVGAARVDQAGGQVVLADGRVLAADVVLAAVGARPASQWLVGAVDLAPDGAVEVDGSWLVPGGHGRLAAVGDLARRRSVRFGSVPGGHWDAALRGPQTAVGALLAGPSAPADPAPYVFSTQLGHELGLHGQPGASDEVVLRGDPDGPFTALWFRRGTDLVGAVLAVDRPRDVSAARRLFAGPGLPRLSRPEAADPTRPLR